MDNKQIEEAVKIIHAYGFIQTLSPKDNRYLIDALNTLISLAQLFSSVSKGAPQKKEKDYPNQTWLKEQDQYTKFNQGYNLCHDEFTAWLVNKVDIKRIQEIILNNILKYDKGQELNVLGTASAIKTMIMGGNNGK